MKPGAVIGGKYRVERVIGQGGMGVVVAARHLELEQWFAIKLLPSEHSGDPELVARFMREARASARLKSDHAVKVIDIGNRRGRNPFMVMELLLGEDLGTIVSRGPLALPDAIDFVLQASEAVAEAHALGIVHRDLKPRNLFLTRGYGGAPFIKVLDFGLAKRINVPSRSLTVTGSVLGSPQYMSPEQMRGLRDLDGRTDIWSLGVCLYELLTGRMPFEAEAVAEICAMVLKDPPRPLASLRPDIPRGVVQIVERCLAKEPSHRFATVSELVAALEPYGPPRARGAGARIAAVIRAVPPPSLSVRQFDSATDTHGPATYDSDSRRARTSWMPIMIGASALFAVTGAALIASAVISTARGRQPNLRERALYEPEVVSFESQTAAVRQEPAASSAHP